MTNDPQPQAGATPTASVVFLTQVLGLAAALGAMIYVGGGAVLWLRLNDLELPASAVVAQLPREFVMTIGLRELVLPLVLLAAINSLLVLGLDLLDRVGERLSRIAGRQWARRLLAVAPPREEVTRRELVENSAMVAVLLTFGVIALYTDDELSEVAPLFFYYVLPLAILPFLRVPMKRWRETRFHSPTARHIAFVLYLAMVHLPAAVIVANWQWEPQRALVCTKRGEPIEGILIGPAAESLYVGEPAAYTGGAPRVAVVPNGEITRYWFVGRGEPRSVPKNPCPPAEA